MKVALLLALAILPLAYAGGPMFDEMMKRMEDMMDNEAGKNGDEPRGDDGDKGGDEKGMQDMMKDMGIDFTDFQDDSDEKKDDHDDSEEKKDDEDCDKDKGDDKDNSGEENEEKKRKYYEAFQEFMKQKKIDNEMQEKKEEYYKRNMFQFRQYMKLQMLKEYEEKKKEMAEKKEEEMERMRMMLRMKYANVSHEYMEERFHFRFGMTKHFLDLCDCDEVKDTINRIKEGEFALPDMPTPTPTMFPGNSTSFPTSNSSENTPPPTPGNSSQSPAPTPPSSGNGTSRSPAPTPPSSGNGTASGSTPNGSPSTMSTTVATPGNGSRGDNGEGNGGMDPQEMKDTVVKIAHMDPEEQFRYALHHLVEEVCDVTKLYQRHLMVVEENLKYYRMMHH